MAPAREVRRTRSSVPGVYLRLNKAGERDMVCLPRQRGSAALAVRLRGERIVRITATFDEFARDWLAGQHQLRPSTRVRYRWAIGCHLIPRFGGLVDVQALCAKPSSGLEPETPSLPWKCSTN